MGFLFWGPLQRPKVNLYKNNFFRSCKVKGLGFLSFSVGMTVRQVSLLGISGCLLWYPLSARLGNFRRKKGNVTICVSIKRNGILSVRVRRCKVNLMRSTAPELLCSKRARAVTAKPATERTAWSKITCDPALLLSASRNGINWRFVIKKPFWLRQEKTFDFLALLLAWPPSRLTFYVYPVGALRDPLPAIIE